MKNENVTQSFTKLNNFTELKNQLGPEPSTWNLNEFKNQEKIRRRTNNFLKKKTIKKQPIKKTSQILKNHQNMT